MRIELLGSGGFHPNERRHTLCVLVPELGLMLDAGTGAFRAHGRVTTPELDVLLTHAHIDHIVGLTALLGLEHDGARVSIRVHALPEVGRAVQDCLFDQHVFPVAVADEFHTLGETPIEINGAQLRPFPLQHPGGSRGVRIDAGGKSLALVTDTTEPTQQTIDTVAGVDLLLHEAYFDDAQAELATVTGHCTASQAARTADRAGAKRLVLLHRDPRAEDDTLPLAQARAIFPAAEYGQDNQVIEL